MLNAEIQTKLDGLTASFATSESQLETFGIGSQRILPGYTGKVVDIKFEMLDSNSGVTPVTRDQVIRIPGADGKLVNLTVAYAENKDYPVVLQMIMEDGRRISVNSIKQSPKSKIGGKQATLMVAKEWFALIGSTLKLESSDDDATTTVRRPVTGGAPNELIARPARYLVFTVTNAAPTAAPADIDATVADKDATAEAGESTATTA